MFYVRENLALDEDVIFFDIQNHKISKRKIQSRFPCRPIGESAVGWSTAIYNGNIFETTSLPRTTGSTSTTAHVFIDGYTSRRVKSAPTISRDVFFSLLRSSFRVQQSLLIIMHYITSNIKIKIIPIIPKNCENLTNPILFFPFNLFIIFSQLRFSLKIIIVSTR